MPCRTCQLGSSSSVLWYTVYTFPLTLDQWRPNAPFARNAMRVSDRKELSSVGFVPAMNSCRSLKPSVSLSLFPAFVKLSEAQ